MRRCAVARRNAPGGSCYEDSILPMQFTAFLTMPVNGAPLYYQLRACAPSTGRLVPRLFGAQMFLRVAVFADENLAYYTAIAVLGSTPTAQQYRATKRKYFALWAASLPSIVGPAAPRLIS